MESLDKCCRRSFPFGAILDFMTVKGFNQNTLNTWSRRNRANFMFPARVLKFQETTSREPSGLEEKNKTDYFPEGPYISCSPRYLDFWEQFY